MSHGNDLADRATKMIAFALLSNLELAKEFHKRFHVTAETLRHRFDITKKEARDIVTQCQNCCQFLPMPHVGINPREICPLQVWQMDVTHISSFGKLQYLHVSVDTCSGVMFASPLTGEKAAHVIQHCLEAWSAWGKLKVLKTDNGPAYTSQKFRQFCHQMEITHLTGLPYNPQSQGIIERAHRTLKSYLIKQKGGVQEALPSVPRVTVSLALFTLNFLNLDSQGHSAADRHCLGPNRPKEMIKWKDVLTGQWKGPDPILIRSRGAVCVFPQEENNPFWVPERLTRKLVTAEDDLSTDTPATA
ncbi:endogenous retrovirus group K member 19 Pol protein isoform X1 [Meriones unguiculatus]|uniref:endogenous retrovirus group K member 19 Pol protein isoform X1 n=1 Tax=Meriones unguiculatus TaxID=10047 RepID=UPI00293E2AEA|nr:endogenous retrovirus group K member 19 Pol protein isoform X1 [Meriones unguiculatus]